MAKTNEQDEDKTLTTAKESKTGNKNHAKAVDGLLAKLEQRFGGEDFKATLADYIRLLQLLKELDEEEAKEIKVTWVEPETEPELVTEG